MGAKRSQVWKERAILAPEVNSGPSTLSRGFQTAVYDPLVSVKSV